MSNRLEKKYLWVEKYNPTEFDTMVIGNNYKEKFEGFIRDKEIPHLLFYGPPGSGKTTTARILVNKIIKNKNDLVFINGSLNTGINVIRDQIEEFLRIPSYGESIKIVFIDEADYLSGNAQASLRGIIERYQDNSRFLLTCNRLYKIMDALQSRFGHSYEFKKLPKEYILDYCKGIFEKEEITYDEDDVKKTVIAYYPDVRKIINKLQANTSEGQFKLNSGSIDNKEKLFESLLVDVLKSIKNGSNGTININENVDSMQKLLADHELDYSSIYQDLFNNKDGIPVWSKVIVNKYAASHLVSMIPQMNLMAMVYDIISTGKRLKSLKR